MTARPRPGGGGEPARATPPGGLAGADPAGPASSTPFVNTPNAERYLLQADNLRRRQLRSALLHGSSRTWRDRRRLWPAVVAGLVAIAVISAAIAVYGAFQQQRRERAEEERERQEQERQQEQRRRDVEGMPRELDGQKPRPDLALAIASPYPIRSCASGRWWRLCWSGDHPISILWASIPETGMDHRTDAR